MIPDFPFAAVPFGQPLFVFVHPDLLASLPFVIPKWYNSNRKEVKIMNNDEICRLVKKALFAADEAASLAYDGP